MSVETLLRGERSLSLEQQKFCQALVFSEISRMPIKNEDIFEVNNAMYVAKEALKDLEVELKKYSPPEPAFWNRRVEKWFQGHYSDREGNIAEEDENYVLSNIEKIEKMASWIDKTFRFFCSDISFFYCSSKSNDVSLFFMNVSSVQEMKKSLDKVCQSYIAEYNAFIEQTPPNQIVSHTPNPADHLTLFSRKIGSDKILEAISYLDPKNTIYSVGSGMGAVEKLASHEGLRVICIDPFPASCFQTGDQHCFIKPDYAYLDHIEQIDEQATLFLLAPSPWESWDIEAVRKHSWKQIMLIVETSGSAGSDELLNWLKPILAGEASQENYTLKYQAIKHEQTGLDSPFWGGSHYTCVVLEKGYQDKPKIVEETLYEDFDFDLAREVQKMKRKL